MFIWSAKSILRSFKECLPDIYDLFFEANKVYNTDQEKKIAEKVLEDINNKLDGKVVTKISKEKNYCKAEEYHQKYFQKKIRK